MILKFKNMTRVVVIYQQIKLSTDFQCLLKSFKAVEEEIPNHAKLIMYNFITFSRECDMNSQRTMQYINNKQNIDVILVFIETVSIETIVNTGTHGKILVTQ